MRLRALLACLLVLAASGSASAFSFPKLHNYPRWTNENPFGESPIRVHVIEDSDAYVPEALNALAWWEDGGNGKLHYDPRFTMVKSAEEARLVIQFVSALRNDDHPIASVWNDPKSGLVFVEVAAPSTGERMSMPDAVAAIAHALGHALGLEESTDPDDIMAYKTQASALTYLPPSTFDMYLPYVLVVVGLVAAVGVGNIVQGRLKAHKRHDPWKEMITPQMAARWRTDVPEAPPPAFAAAADEPARADSATDPARASDERP